MSQALPARLSVVPTRSLLGALIRNIDESFQSSTHLRETEVFLLGMKERFRWYDQLLEKLAGHPKCPSDMRDLAVKMICQMIYQLINPVKGLCEGTTDRIPFALATYLSHEFRSLRQPAPKQNHDTVIPSSTGPGPQVGIALCPVPDMNYYYLDVGQQVSATFESLDKDLERDVLKPLDMGMELLLPAFPPSLILVGFQYAMVEDTLFNAVLFHELGHHIFAESFAELYRKRLHRKLDRVFHQKLPVYRKLTRSDRGFFLELHLDVLMNWAGEIFSDLVAVGLAGPQFAFALHDLSIPSSMPMTFTITHPADKFRAFQQSQMLIKAGWIQKQPRRNVPFDSLAGKELHKLERAKLPAGRRWVLHGLAARPDALPLLVHQLTLVCATIRQDALHVVKDAKERAREFWQLGPDVFAAFTNWVVPSTIITKKRMQRMRNYECTDIRPGKRRVNRYHPRPSTVMNVARFLCQSRQAEGTRKEAPNVDDRGWPPHERVSQWTQKAIADWLLIGDCENGLGKTASERAAIAADGPQARLGDNTPPAPAGRAR